MVNILFLLLSLIFFSMSIILLIYCFYRPFPSNQGITGQTGDPNGPQGPTGSQGGTGLIGPYGPEGAVGVQGQSSDVFTNAVTSFSASPDITVKTLSGVFINVPQLLPQLPNPSYLQLYYDENLLPGGTFYIYSEVNSLIVQNALISGKKYINVYGSTMYYNFGAGLIQCVLLGDQTTLACDYINS